MCDGESADVAMKRKHYLGTLFDKHDRHVKVLASFIDPHLELRGPMNDEGTIAKLPVFGVDGEEGRNKSISESDSCCVCVCVCVWKCVCVSVRLCVCVYARTSVNVFGVEGEEGRRKLISESDMCCVWTCVCVVPGIRVRGVLFFLSCHR